MTEFKKAYRELKTKPILWFHYALGTVVLYLFMLVYNFMQYNNSVFQSIAGIFMQDFTLWGYIEQTFSLQFLILFYLFYVIIDRFIHGLLELV